MKTSKTHLFTRDAASKTFLNQRCADYLVLGKFIAIPGIVANFVAVVTGHIRGSARAIASEMTHLVTVVTFNILLGCGTITGNVVILTAPKNRWFTLLAFIQ